MSSTTSITERWPRWLVLLATFAVALWPAAARLDLTLEDGYYYLEIARHLARGDGSTFDGLHPTNGYHPLWLLLLAGVFTLTDTAAEALWAAHLVQGLLIAAGAVVLERAVRRQAGPVGGIVAVLVWTALTHRVWWSGLEFSLQALALTVLLALDLEDRASARRDLLFALSSAFLVLIRLETVLLVVLLHLAHLAGRRPARRVLLTAAPAGAALLGYLAFNRTVFGHLLPVSATVKRLWSAELLDADPVRQESGRLAAELWELVVPLVKNAFHPSFLPLVVGLAAAGLWGVLAARRAAPPRLAPWVAYGVLHYLSVTFLHHGNLRFPPWYWAVQPLVAAVLLGILAGRLRRRAGAVLVAAVGVLAVLAIVRFGREAARPSFAPMRTAARWMRANLPETSRIGAWNAGTVGFLSERQVVNLDGLVNSWDFAEHRRHDLCRYFRETGVTHVADVFRGPEAISAVPTLASYAPCVDRFELLWEDDSFDPRWSLRVYRLRVVWASG